MAVPHVDVWASWRKSCDMCRRAVVWLGRMEAALRECEVVAAGAERVPGDDAGQLVPRNPMQGGFAILEHTGRKPRVLAVEDPDLRQVNLGVCSVLAHGKKVSQLAWRSPDQASHLPRSARRFATTDPNHHHDLVLRLRAQDQDLVLDEARVRCVQFWLLEVLPATRCRIHAGPGIQLLAPEREAADLTSAVRRRIEEIIGCSVLVDDDPLAM